METCTKGCGTVLSMNVVGLVGRLAGMPTFAVNERGNPTAAASLLVVETGHNEVQFKTFIPLTAHGKTAERLGDLTDGDLIGVSGKLSWSKGRNGQNGRVEVFCLAIEVMDDEP